MSTLFRLAAATIGLLAILSGAAMAATTSATFSPPLIRAVSPDACLTPGGDCGKTTADAFCKAAGFQESRKHVPLSAWKGALPSGVTMKTIYLGNGKTCGRECQPLVLIACYSSTPTFSATSSSDFGTVTGP